MNPPRRLRDDTATPAELRSLLRGGRPTQRMPADAIERTSARVRKLALVPATAAGVLVGFKGIALAALCAGTVATAIGVAPLLIRSGDTPAPQPAVSARHRAPACGAAEAAPSAAPVVTPPVVPSAVARPVVLAPSAIVAPVNPTPSAMVATVNAASSAAAPVNAPPSAIAAPVLAAPGPVRASAALSRNEAGPAPADSLAQEASLLEKARSLIDTNPGQALAALDRHAALFPTGHLVMEREILAVEALKRLGLRARARDRAAVLLESARGSIYEPRVRAMVDALSVP